MPRFYKTASANPLDYMHKLNTPLMEKVIGANDDFITQNLTQAGQLENLATSFPFLQADEGRANEIMSGYSKKIDDITKAIRDDPANWRKQLDPMRTVSRELQQNYKVGEISKITGNYSQYKKVADSIDKQVEEYNKTGKGISADRAKAYKEYFLKQFTTKDAKGTNFDAKTGEYNSINVFDPMGNIDIKKVLSEEMDKIRADKRHYKRSEVTGDEWYFNDKTETWEGITPDKILSIATDRLSNPQLQDYMRQDSMVGAMSGVYDKDGKMIAPYKYKGVSISPEEQKNIDNIRANIIKTKDLNKKAQLQGALSEYENGLNQRREIEWNNESSLSPILRGITNQYSFGQTSEENTLRNNSAKNTIYSQAQQNARTAATLKQQKEIADAKEKGINERYDRTLEEKKREWDNPHATGKSGSTGLSGTGKKTTSAEPPPVESTVSKFATKSYEDWTTTDANNATVKVLSPAGLSADINKFSTDLVAANKKSKDLATQMKDFLGNRKVEDLDMAGTIRYNKMLVEKDAIDMKIPDIQSKLNSRVQWQAGSMAAVLTNNQAARKDKDGDYDTPLTAEELAIYKGGQAAMDKKKAVAKDYFDKAVKISQDLAGYKYKLGSPEYKAAFKEHERLSKLASDAGYSASSYGVSVDESKFDDYAEVKKKVDKRQAQFLDQMRWTPVQSDAIKLGGADMAAIGDMIVNNPQSTQLFDSGGNKAKKELEGKGLSFKNWGEGDNYNMTTDAERNIFEYMKRTKGAKMIVEEIGTTTKIGNGNAIAKIRFEDPENGQLPTGDYYMELSPELQKQVATRMVANKNTDVSKIAGNLLDSEANDIRRQLITPTIQQTAGASDSFDPVTFTVFINNGNTKIPFQVTKFAAEDGTDHLQITGTNAQGVQVPLPGTASKIPGWFNGAEDFINYIKTQRTTK